MAAVMILLVALAPGTGDTVAADTLAATERKAAWLRRRGYDADVCGVDHGPTAPDTLLRMLTDKRPNGIVFGAGIRLDPRHTRLFERLLNLAQITRPDTVVMFDTGPADIVATVRVWFPSADEG